MNYLVMMKQQKNKSLKVQKNLGTLLKQYTLSQKTLVFVVTVDTEQLYLLVKDIQISQKRKVQQMVNSQQIILVNLIQYQMEMILTVFMFMDINQKILRLYQKITKLQLQVVVLTFHYQEKKLKNYQKKHLCGKEKFVLQAKNLEMQHTVLVVRTSFLLQKSMVITMTKGTTMFTLKMRLEIVSLYLHKQLPQDIVFQKLNYQT